MICRSRCFIVGVLTLFLTGCLGSNIHPHPGTLGIEASSTSVQAAINQALSGISIANAKIGACVTYEENYRVDAGPVVMQELIKHKLLSITQNTNSVIFNLFEDYYKFLPSGAISDQVHRQIPLDFQTNSAITSRLNASDSQCNGKVQTGSDNKQYDCIRYYNLETDDQPVPAPEAIQQKPNCLGFVNCEIPAHHIRYDMVKFLKGQEVEKISIDAHFSPVIPDLYYIPQPDGSVLYTEANTSFCTTEMITDSDNTEHLVRFCSVLRDMEPAGSGDCFPPTP